MFSLRKTTECLPLKPENPEESDTALTDNDDDDDDQVEDPDYQPIHREDARDMLFNLLMMRRTLRQQAPFLNHCHIKRGEKTKKNTLRIVFMAEPEATLETRLSQLPDVGYKTAVVSPIIVTSRDRTTSVQKVFVKLQDVHCIPAFQ